MGKIQKKKSLLKIAETCKAVEVYSPLYGSEFTDWDNIRPFDFDISELPATFTGAHRINGDVLEIIWEVDKIEVKENRGGARQGSGPKSLYKGESKTKITLSLVDRAIELLNEESELLGLSRSDILNSLIFENLKHVDYEQILNKMGWVTNVDIDSTSTKFTAKKGDRSIVVEKDPCYCAASEEDVCNKVWKEIYNENI